MKYLKSTLLVLLCCSGLLQATDSPVSTDIAYFTRLSKKLRQSSSHLSSKEDERLTRLNHEFLRELPQYGKVDKMEKVIIALARDALKIDLDPSQIVDSHQTSFHGLSNAHVFFIYDTSGALQYVFKAFPPPRIRERGVLAELSSMELVRERHLDLVTTSTPLAVGKCSFQGEMFGLLLQSAAKGQRADQYLNALNAFPRGDPQREERFQIAKRMCHALGKGLAEFNGLASKQRAALARMGVLGVKMEFYSILTHQVRQKLAGKLDLLALKQYVDRTLTRILKMNSGRFYCHGDAGLGNIFYDPVTHQITLIDVLRIHRKITRHGSPLSRSLHDLLHVRKSIHEKGAGKLTREELRQLAEALHAGFVHEKGDSKKNLYHRLIELALSCEYDNIANPNERKKQQAVFQTNLDYINSLLKKDVD